MTDVFIIMLAFVDLLIQLLVNLMCSGVTMEDGVNWSSQINRLQELLDKLECQV